MPSPFPKFVIGKLGEASNHAYFIRIVRMQARAIQVMEPFIKVPRNVFRVFVIRIPHAFPHLIRLILSRNKAPIKTADSLQKEQREHLLDGIPETPSEPLCVDDGSA